jgi:hypothetical protein
MLKINKAPKIKDESFIPDGMYCHGMGSDNEYICPYWDFDDERPHQENGYCHFMEKGDWNINTEGEQHIAYSKDHPEWVDDKVSDHPELPQIGWGLLWDQCKECGIKFSLPGEKE